MGRQRGERRATDRQRLDDEKVYQELRLLLLRCDAKVEIKLELRLGDLFLALILYMRYERTKMTERK